MSMATTAPTRRPRVNLAVVAPIVALIVLVLIGMALNPNFLSFANITNVLARSAFIGIIAIGMTFVITAGGLDLSVGSMAAFIAGLMILVMNAALPTLGVGIPIILLGMAVALLAQGWEPGAALLGAVHLHGAAADTLPGTGVGPIGLTASETAVAARALFNAWCQPAV